MTTQELLADGLITYSYVAVGIPHKMNIRANLKRSSVEVGSMPIFQDNTNGTTFQDADELTLLFLPDVLKLYPSTDHFDSYQVHDMSTSPPTWLFEKTISGYVGTHSGASSQRAEGENVLTMRDARGRQSKLILLGTVLGNLAKVTGLGSVGFEDLVNALLSRAIDKSGGFITGRGGVPFVSFVSYCVSSNNAIEKKIVFG